MKDDCAVIIPIKNLRYAKSRLSTSLTFTERKKFVFSMLMRILKEVNKVPEINKIFVVSSDEEILLKVQEYAVPVLETGHGLNSALNYGIKAALEENVSSVLILPGDLPLISRNDIKQIYKLGIMSQTSVVLAPCKKSDGTNALFLRPPDILIPQFGHRSFYNHMRAAKEKGIMPSVYSSDTIRMDLDEPKDLEKCRELIEIM